MPCTQYIFFETSTLFFEKITQICADIPDQFAHIFKHVIHTIPMQLDVHRIS